MGERLYVVKEGHHDPGGQKEAICTKSKMDGRLGCKSPRAEHACINGMRNGFLGSFFNISHMRAARVKESISLFNLVIAR